MSSGDEDELESYLQRRALLRAHRSYQERLEPPPELDRIVLRKARLAIQSRHPPHREGSPVVPAVALTPAPRPPHRPRWYAPASVAATMLVCLTLLVNLGAHALRSDESATTAALHEESAEPLPQASGPVLAKVVDTEPAPAVYTGAPIFEVVIRTARLSTHPVSDTPRSAGPASR